LNAKTLADGLIQRGFDLVSGGTDNHLMLADLRKFNTTGKEMEVLLDSVYITANKNKIPNDPQPAAVTSGIRLGSPAVTSRGFKETEMEKIAELVHLTVTDYEAKSDYIRNEVNSLCEKYPQYE
jgi:glycine hydroxymethyltransferase